MKKGTLYFDFTMELKCPHCDSYIDVDENDDDYHYLTLFRKWISNVDKEDWHLDEFKEICSHCDKEIGIKDIER